MQYQGSLTDVEKVKIRSLLREGKSVREIPEIVGASYGKVRRFVEFDSPYDPFNVFVWDLETTDLNTFFGVLIVASFLNIADGTITTRTFHDFPSEAEPHSDEWEAEKETALLHWTLDRIFDADILIGHNTLAFDLSFLRGRLSSRNIDREVPKRMHYDTLQIARHGFKGRPGGYSLENLAEFWNLSEKKDKPAKSDWSASTRLNKPAIRRIARRCESDVRVNAMVWDRLRPAQNRWKGK